MADSNRSKGGAPWPVDPASLARATRRPDNATGGSARSAESGRPAGRVVHDERGNAVWSWAKDGRTTDSTSRILKSLDVPDLAIEGEEGRAASSSRTTRRAGSAVPDPGGGYNPYDHRRPTGKPGKPPDRRGR